MTENVRENVCCLHKREKIYLRSALSSDKNPLKCGLGLPWLKIGRKFTSRLRHPSLYVNGERVWPLHVKFNPPQRIFLQDIRPRIKQSPKLEDWHLDNRPELQLISWLADTVKKSSDVVFNSRLMHSKDISWSTYSGKHSGPVVWVITRNSLLDRNKLSRNKNSISPACPRRGTEISSVRLRGVS